MTVLDLVPQCSFLLKMKSVLGVGTKSPFHSIRDSWFAVICTRIADFQFSSCPHRNMFQTLFCSENTPKCAPSLGDYTSAIEIHQNIFSLALSSLACRAFRVPRSSRVTVQRPSRGCTRRLAAEHDTPTALVHKVPGRTIEQGGRGEAAGGV